ncbi:DUF2071 domain-containing protein [Marivirga sp. S37H4]|uniref:DUF2071 domain-containing protein n=1 Tax=Marivirga aurantiaca TaxID=2802615 RepID=A0A934WYG1_9BACT|nr:DUF2071 domain-containing protein [Marivirga aurantiaca]MBK6265217.1 DUF2071 domain-containing protein [Marivirga aurantiaca]
MKIRNLLNTTAHRPWNLPKGSWKYYQEWNNAIFLHWQVDYEELREFVPGDLEIDLFEGKPWVSIVAFRMEKIRPRNLPAFAPISNFEEINIRTYIKSGVKTGVYFLSIEGGKRLSCKIAKLFSELPYRFSRIERGDNRCQSANREFNDSLNVKFTVGEEIAEKSLLDNWLTERYALFQDSTSAINQFEIHHLEWPLKSLALENSDINYSRFGSLLNNTPDKMHYSEGVKVLAWGKERM